MDDAEYRKKLLASYRPRFSRADLIHFCMCWTFDSETGLLRVTPKSGVTVDFLKENIVPVGMCVERLPESECAFGKLKR